MRSITNTQATNRTKTPTSSRTQPPIAYVEEKENTPTEKEVPATGIEDINPYLYTLIALGLISMGGLFMFRDNVFRRR